MQCYLDLYNIESAHMYKHTLLISNRVEIVLTRILNNIAELYMITAISGYIHHYSVHYIEVEQSGR